MIKHNGTVYKRSLEIPKLKYLALEDIWNGKFNVWLNLAHDNACILLLI